MFQSDAQMRYTVMSGHLQMVEKARSATPERLAQAKEKVADAENALVGWGHTVMLNNSQYKHLLPMVGSLEPIIRKQLIKDLMQINPNTVTF